MEAIGKTIKKINCIPQNHEKYIPFSLGKMERKVPVNISGKTSQYPGWRGSFQIETPSNLHGKIPTGQHQHENELISSKEVYPYRQTNSFDLFEQEDLP